MRTYVRAEELHVEMVERRGERETSWSALCLECGWQSEDTQRRAVAEQRAQEHRAGVLLPWQDPSRPPGWDIGR